MTEHKRTIPQEPLTSFPKRYVPQKRWKLTRSDNQDPAKVTRNFVIDQGCRFLLGKVKALYQGSGTEAFERDLRHDRSYTATGMHAFITPDLMLSVFTHHLSQQTYMPSCVAPDKYCRTHQLSPNRA